MERTILAVPVDGRPVTCDQVALLAATAGWNLLLPPRDLLGRMRVAGDRDGLAKWLLHAAANAGGLVLSLDMLVYGGLVPSRLSDETEEPLADRLGIFRLLRERHPRIPITVFAATMRISNNNHAEEERSYWADHGRDIWKWSYHLDRHSVLGNADDRRIAAEIEYAIPETILSDYKAVRERNVSITRRALEMVAAGLIDFLVLPQDDTATFGINLAERRALIEQAGRLGVGDRVTSYPGADEVIWTQVARLIARSEGIEPTFALDWGEPEAASTMIARYEDRPIGETLAAQIEAVGGRIVDIQQGPKTRLFVHTAGLTQGEWALDIWPDDNHPSVSTGWLDRVASRLSGDGPVALLDLAHANGGDPLMIASLGERVPLDKLHAYAGWNTAGNSIGSAVALCAIPCHDAAAHRVMLATRFVDDLVYQAGCRQEIRAAGVDVASPDDVKWAVEKVFRPQANAWLSEHGFADLAVADVWFPWDRTFEIGFTMKQTSVGAPM